MGGDPHKSAAVALKLRRICSSLLPYNLLTLIIILAGLYFSVLILAYMRNESTLNNSTFLNQFTEGSPWKSVADVDDDLSDPFKYLPPEEEMRAAQEQHEKLKIALRKEREFAAKVSQILEKLLDQQDCPLKRKPALTSNCAHIEERGWREIGGVKTYFIITQCSDALTNGYPWVLFLHGAAFSAQTWVDLNILRLTAKTGFNNLAIDLPGFGNSSKPASNVDHVGFLDAVLKEFKLNKVVVVSPSMSGSYSIQYLQKRNDRFAGFVAVAPASLGALTQTDFDTIQTPTLVIYGEQDTGMGIHSKEVLGKLKNSKTFEIKNAGHPCYRDQPESFMVEFFKFLMCSVRK